MMCSFSNIFKNRKSSKKIDSYYAFYEAIYNFNKAIELDEKYAKGTIRISLGKRNNAEDADYIVDDFEKWSI